MLFLVILSFLSLLSGFFFNEPSTISTILLANLVIYFIGLSTEIKFDKKTNDKPSVGYQH